MDRYEHVSSKQKQKWFLIQSRWFNRTCVLMCITVLFDSGHLLTGELGKHSRNNSHKSLSNQDVSFWYYVHNILDVAVRLQGNHTPIFFFTKHVFLAEINENYGVDIACTRYNVYNENELIATPWLSLPWRRTQTGPCLRHPSPLTPQVCCCFSPWLLVDIVSSFTYQAAFAS